MRIFLEDASGAREEATVRQVFDLGAAKWSRYAQTHDGAWMTVALFDLPESGLAVPGTATVIVEIAGVEDAERQGTIHLTGAGGAPTDIVFPNGGDTAEALLGSEPILRLRAVRADAGNPGFHDWTIGGIEFDLEYVLFGLVAGVDFFLYGAMMHVGGSPGLPRLQGNQVLVVAIVLTVGGIAMVWSGSRPKESESSDRG